MAFFMPVYNIVKKLGCALLLLLLMQSTSMANVFSVNNPHIHKIGNGYVLNANVSYPLTPRVIEALENGIPITFFQEFQLIRPFPVLGNLLKWDKDLWHSTLYYELRYHALSDTFLLLSLDTRNQQSFSSLQSALHALGTISNMNLPPKYTQDKKKPVLQIRSGLDLSALPTPMRPGVLLSSKWQLTSPWVNAVWP